MEILGGHRFGLIFFPTDEVRNHNGVTLNHPKVTLYELLRESHVVWAGLVLTMWPKITLISWFFCFYPLSIGIIYRFRPPSQIVCGGGDQTQGLVCAGQVLCQVSWTTGLQESFDKHMYVYMPWRTCGGQRSSSGLHHVGPRDKLKCCATLSTELTCWPSVLKFLHHKVKTSLSELLKK